MRTIDGAASPCRIHPTVRPAYSFIGLEVGRCVSVIATERAPSHQLPALTGLTQTLTPAMSFVVLGGGRRSFASETSTSFVAGA
jgi:hypothetical protein